MAWRGNPTNPVPNPVQEAVNRSEGRVVDNRALHTRRDTDKLKNFTVTIKDIDETVFGHLQKMNLLVVDSGNHIKVPVSYASPEKWKSVQNDGFMRDNNGRIILPALIFYRTSSESDKDMMTFNKYLRYAVMKQYSIKNQYTKFSVLMNRNVPVNEVYNVVMPDHMVFNYKFIVWTEYIEQMNSLIERINFETNDYWGVERGFRFRTFVNSYIHTTEVEAGSDRLIKTEFDLTLRGYLLPDLFAPGLDGFRPTTEKTFTAKKVILGTEVVSTDWQPVRNKLVDDRWRSQQYPNLVSGTEPRKVGLQYEDINEQTVDKTSVLNPTPDSPVWDVSEETWDLSDIKWTV